jgi:hypothetical protein
MPSSYGGKPFSREIQEQVDEDKRQRRVTMGSASARPTA